jgi:uncharacterized protein (TIGR03085 family)
MTTNPARTERRALCDTLLTVGPDAPTLCGSWSTRDLAAHLVIRERRPDAALGILAAPFRSHGEKVRLAEAARPFEELVDRVRSGPPSWSPQRIGTLDRLTNTAEYFVHHEDILRGAGSGEPRELDPALVDALGTLVRRGARLLGRAAPGGLVLAPDGMAPVVAKKGEPAVTVAGPIGEIVLFVYGRQSVARVNLDGPDELVEATRTARFGV